MNLIDTHCHLYSAEFDNDRDAVIARAVEKGVTSFFLPAIDSSTHASMISLEEKYPQQCFAMMGLHPCSANDKYEHELAIVEQWLKQRRFCAIGEIGLDFYWDTTFTTAQYTSFERQMEWALQYKLPIIIHTRNAMQETIDAVKPFAAKGLRGIFHCFGGSYEEALKILDLNFLLGIGGVVTYKNSGLKEVLAKVGIAHCVLETDAPYLTPVPFRGKRNESSYLEFVVKMLAEITNKPMDEVAMITTENAQKIFGI